MDEDFANQLKKAALKTVRKTSKTQIIGIQSANSFNYSDLYVLNSY